ncbi:MAG: glycosyltransferase family 4 protein, partial [Microbacterium sp.]
GVRASRRTLARTIRSVAPQIVHSHLAYADIVSAWTRLPAGVRRITTEHGIAGDDGVYHRSGMQSRVMAFVHRIRFGRFDGVIAVSRATREAMLAKWRVRQPIAVIPNGVDLPSGVERRPPASVAGLRVLSLSRLAPEKRIDRLVEAFALLRTARPDATLTIAGEGPLLAELQALAARRGVPVAFPGFADPETAMAAADVVVQLSVWENCSYTLLDAVARGLRVVAAEVGGNPEVADPASLIADVGDVAAVARAIEESVPGGAPAPSSVAEMCAAVAREYGRPPR